MVSDELALRIRQHFGHTPTQEQEAAIRVFADFLFDH